MTLGPTSSSAASCIHVLPERLPSHPPLWPVRQRRAHAQPRASPRVARRARPQSEPGDAEANPDEPPAKPLPCPVLRWPHDHHRDLRARRHTAHSSADPDRGSTRHDAGHASATPGCSSHVWPISDRQQGRSRRCRIDAPQPWHRHHARSRHFLRPACSSACAGASPPPHPIFSADHDTPANATFPIARGAAA